jgi:hypothetical protein
VFEQEGFVDFDNSEFVWSREFAGKGSYQFGCSLFIFLFLAGKPVDFLCD